MNKSRAVLLVLILGTPLMAWLCLILGSSGIGFPDLGTPIGKAIFSLRANRVAGGFIVGAALSCAGVPAAGEGGGTNSPHHRIHVLLNF